MIHEMRLDPDIFEEIKNGNKTIEYRLYDEKRRKIKAEDKIYLEYVDEQNRNANEEKELNKDFRN